MAKPQARIKNLITDTYKTIFTKLKKHILGLTVIVALTILVCRNLIFSPDFPAGVDMLGWIMTISGPIEYRYLTEEVQTLRLPLLIINSLFFNNAMLVIKIFIVTTFLFSGLSMYFFTYHYTKKRTASIFSSAVFMMNQWHISKWASGDLNHAFAYAMLPLLFLSFDKALKSGKPKPIIIFSAISALILLCRLDPFVLCAPFLMLYAIFTIAIPYDKMRRKTALTHITKVALIGGLFVFLFSAFQLIPILLRLRVGYYFIEKERYVYGALGTELFEARSLGFFESLLGLSRELSYLLWVGGLGWTKHPFLTLFQYQIVMAALPIIAFSAIIFRKDRQTLFFIFSALISVFLAKGPHPPFGEAFLWLYFNAPLFNLLTTPNRWLMITYLPYAFLAGTTVSAFYTKLQNVRDRYLTRATRLQKILRIMIRPLQPILLLSLMIPVSFGSWYAISNGLMTYHLPNDKQYVQPYLWIAEQPGDFRVATVPYYQSMMWTGEWWEHDIGCESTLYHGRPVLGIGEGNMYAQNFLNYTYGLVLNDGTNNLMKILGIFNVKYLVVQGYYPTLALPPGYSRTYQHRFFSRQNGLQPVYVYGNSTVYENEFWIPHLFTASKYAIVIGGREAFTALSTIDGFQLNKWCLLFADQMATNQSNTDRFIQLLNESQAIIFVNTKPLDLVMLTLKEAIKIRAVDYAHPSTDQLHYWVTNEWCTRMGMLVINNYLLSTSGNVSTSIPIEAKTSGEYDLWIRVLYGPDQGKLIIKINDQEIGSVIPYAPSHSGLKWIKIGTIDLDQGKHQLVLMNSKWQTGDSNSVDEILLVQPQKLRSSIDQITELLQKSSARIINIIEAEQVFKWVTTSDFYGWQPTSWSFNASNGYVASTVFMLTNWESAIRGGGLEPIIDEGCLKLSGTSTRSPSGVRVFSKEAFTPPFTIKVKVNQVNYTREVGSWELCTIGLYQDDKNNVGFGYIEYDVTGNSLAYATTINGTFTDYGSNLIETAPDLNTWHTLEFRYDGSTLEMFLDGVKKASVPITLTNPKFEMAIGVMNPGLSINSLFDEVTVETKDGIRTIKFEQPEPVWVPWSYPIWKDGYYNIALRLVVGPDHGTLQIRVDNTSTHLIECYSQENAFKWIILNPLYFQAGDHTFGLYGEGKVEIDQIVIYSLTDKETTLDDVFKTEPHATVSYEMMNPTKYVAHVKTEAPFFLIFSDAYHPLWKAYINSEEIKSTLVYSFINGFYLTKIGEYDVTIEFIGQRYVTYGGIISITSIVFTVIYLTLGNKINQFVAKKLKPKQK